MEIEFKEIESCPILFMSTINIFLSKGKVKESYNNTRTN